MKKFIYAGMAFSLLLIVGLITYGAYLNFYGEKQIARRVDERRVELVGTQAEIRDICPVFKLDTMSLQAEQMADTVALIDGRIMNIMVKVDDVVTEGQEICILSNPEYAIQVQEISSNIMEAEARLRQAQSDYERYQRLWAQEAASKEKLEVTQTALAAAEAQLEALQAKKAKLLLQESYQKVTAPISGSVLIVYQPEGTFVKAGTPLLLIGNDNVLQFASPMEDKLVPWFPVGSEADVSLILRDFQKAYDTSYGEGNQGKSQHFTATVTEIDPELDKPAAMRRVVWQIDNRSGILDMKTYKEVELTSRLSHKCLTVPHSAVVRASIDRPFVFVVDENETIALRNVELGIQDNDYVEILSGLNPGEVVITSGKAGLYDGMKVKVEVR